MSMMMCSGCDAFIDTDYDVEGLYEDASPFRFWCSFCTERTDNEAMLIAMEIQEPERYAELMESRS